MANKKIFKTSKRDMNFFSEFTSSSGQTGSYVSFILLVLLGLLILGGAIFAVVFLQTATIQKDINFLNTKMQSESYQSDLVAYSDINNNMALLNQQSYIVSSLFSRVESMGKIDSKYMDTIYENVPSDITITNFTYSEGTITLIGAASSYYSPMDMIANFSAVKLFTYVGINDITLVDLSASGLTQEEIALAKKYTFTIDCSLKSNYAVVVSKFIDSTAATPLTAVKSQTLGVGEQYIETNINTFTTEDGSQYTLNRILVNDLVVPEADMAVIRQNDSISGLVTSNVKINLYYILSNGGN